MTRVVVSAHLDDAVLSCGGRIGPEDLVVTVFAGIPPVGTPLGLWDRITGADDSAPRVARRQEEDSRALAVLAAEKVHLHHLDGQYRAGPSDLDAITEDLAQLLAGAEQVWLPAGVGGHADHLAARDAGLAAAREADLPVTFYADLPYSVAYGWPAWVTDEPAHPFLDVAVWLECQLEAGGLRASALAPQVHRLGVDAVERKMRAVEAYDTQVPALDAQCGGRLRDVRTVSYEVSWAATPR